MNVDLIGDIEYISSPRLKCKVEFIGEGKLPLEISRSDAQELARILIMAGADVEVLTGRVVEVEELKIKIRPWKTEKEGVKV